MSRSYKISLILKCRSSMPVYKELDSMSDSELEEHVRNMVRRMRKDESAQIARMVLPHATFSMN